MELSIDTSTDWGGVALSREGRLLAGLTWQPGQNHSTELHPNIRRVLETAKADLKQVRAVFAAIGPGSFNGLRAGISAAKGIAFSLGIPLVGMSTLEVEAYQFAGIGMPVCAVHDAGRGELAAALFSGEQGWHRLKQEHLATVEQLCAETRTKTLFCGEIPDAAIQVISSLLRDRAVIPGRAQRLRGPACLAELGWLLLQSGKTADLATLQPIYLRQPPITQRKKKY